MIINNYGIMFLVYGAVGGSAIVYGQRRGNKEKKMKSENENKSKNTIDSKIGEVTVTSIAMEPANKKHDDLVSVKSDKRTVISDDDTLKGIDSSDQTGDRKDKNSIDSPI